ncbi:putative RNA-dependent RNA polymerase 1 like protein [Argiope bruennichi]|uniref:RNA-dependent RNA polymerase n=1 Tax=Argiope bruennichi TaxID=94029 RepID=A0A8T0FNQ4_ARGBR|nr:putative RNA-dependent RNA polymerase 1 like protein [Argiope bruennichi]
MANQTLNLEFLWLLNREDSLEVNKIIDASSGDNSLKPSGPLLKLKKDLSSFCGFPIFLKDCKKRDKFAESNRSDEKKSTNEYSLFNLEFLFHVFCSIDLETNPEVDFRRFVNLFYSSKHGNLASDVYLRSASAPLSIENKISTHTHDIDVIKFSLGNFVGLNKFYERFDSSISVEKDKYKITQVKLSLIHDYRKLILYFCVGKICSARKRNKNTHNWYKFELQYSSIYSIIISKCDGLTLYLRLLLPPLMYSMIQDDSEEEDCPPYHEIDCTTTWFRAVDLYENCPSDLKKEFSMNTVLKLDLLRETYDFIFPSVMYCTDIQLFFAPVYVIRSTIPPVTLTFSLNSKCNKNEKKQKKEDKVAEEKWKKEEFECFYALQCLLNHSFEINDQLVCRQESDIAKLFMKDKRKENPIALSRALYQIFDSITKRNVIIFMESLQYLYDCFKKEEPKMVLNDFSSEKQSHLLLIKRAILTPTHVILLPPQPALTSRALCDCEFDYSLKLSIKDVNMDFIHYSLKPYGVDPMECQRNFFNNHYKSTLLKGFSIGKRKYKYVGSSTSQLKGRRLWFYAQDSKGRTSDDLRKQFGSLEKIRFVPQYMARIGQTFSQSMGHIQVPQHWTNVKNPDDDIEGDAITEFLIFYDKKTRKPNNEDFEVEDKVEENPTEKVDRYNFSDGIGRISPMLADEVYKELEVLDQRPSAMQIRYAGCKGMLVVDPTLQGKDIKFRKSMKEFDSDNDSLEILKFSEKRSCFLNRPFITILEQLGVSKEVFLKLQKEMIQKHIFSMFHEYEACEFLNSYSSLRFDFLSMHRAGIHFTEDPFFRSMIYPLFQKQMELLANKANIEIPVNKGRNMLGVVDDTFTLNYGEVFVQYSNWATDEPIVVEGTVVVTKKPCMHPGDVRKFQAVYVKSLLHIKDCIVFPAKGPRPHPDEMAGSYLDGDEYHVMWMKELIFDRDNYPPMHYAIKDNAEELDMPVTISDELDHLCNYIFNDKVGLIASSHLVWADQIKQGIFSDLCIHLAKQYSLALDFAKSGRAVPKLPEDRVNKYPDFMQKLDRKKTYLSPNALGILFRSCKRLELGLETKQNEICYKLDEALIHEKWDKKYKKSALRFYKKYCDKIDYFLKMYNFENEGQFLAGVLVNPPKYYEDRHDLNNIMALIKFETQWIFRDLQKKFFEEFGGKPHDEKYTDEMLQKASAWYMAAYSKTEKKGSHFFGFPWAVSDVLVELKKRNQHLNQSPNTASKSLLEEIIDKAFSKDFKILDADADTEVIYENRIPVLDVAFTILKKWIKSHKEYFSDPDIENVEKYIEKEYNVITTDIVAEGPTFIEKLKYDMKLKRAISPAHNVIETILHVANLGIQNPQNQLFDIRGELGLLAWVTLIKLACTYNPQYLGMANEKGEYASTIFCKDNIIDTLCFSCLKKTILPTQSSLVK